MSREHLPPLRDRLDVARIGTWDGLRLDFPGFIGDYVFRGQNSSRMRLQSTLERFLAESGADPWLAERDLIDRFRRRAKVFLPPALTPRDDDPHGWLGLMQHYGAPTRFLDFTESPFIATHFAVARPSDDCHAVWAVKKAWCRDQATRAVQEWMGCEALEAMIATGELAPTIVRDLLSPAALAMTVRPFALLTEPAFYDPRQSVQQAVFLCQSHVDVPFEEHLPDVGDNVFLWEIPKALRRKALDELHYMGISDATMFPGLEGLARSLHTIRLR